MPIEGVQNAYRVSERLYSGSQPEGDEAFAALARLGIKTIVSVDGAKPDIETAHKHGLHYVHLPFGYDGVPARRVAELAKVAKTGNGLIYVHCHHGRHRGPTAAAIMCLATAGWTPERAVAWLHQAGTSDDYPGLFRSAREFVPPSAAELARVSKLPEVARTTTLVDAMVAIDQNFDRVKQARQAGWKSPAGQPDSSPFDDATLMWEQFREIARFEETAKRPPDFRMRLAEAERSAATLRTCFRDGATGTAPVPAAAEGAFKKAGQACADCHRAYRN